MFMRSWHRSTFIAVLVALLMVGSGCASSDVPDAAAPSSVRVEQSPLDEWLSAGYGGIVTEAEALRQNESFEIRRDELIAECMQEQGFQYIPRGPGADFSSNISSQQSAYLDSLSEAELEAWWEAYRGQNPHGLT